MYTLIITDYNREKKIGAIAFLRALTQARDGRKIGLRESKAAIERVEAGDNIRLPNVPTSLVDLASFAALARGVSIRAEPQYESSDLVL